MVARRRTPYNRPTQHSFVPGNDLREQERQRVRALREAALATAAAEPGSETDKLRARLSRLEVAGVAPENVASVRDFCVEMVWQTRDRRADLLDMMRILLRAATFYVEQGVEVTRANVQDIVLSPDNVDSLILRPDGPFAHCSRGSRSAYRSTLVAISMANDGSHYRQTVPLSQRFVAYTYTPEKLASLHARIEGLTGSKREDAQMTVDLLFSGLRTHDLKNATTAWIRRAPDGSVLIDVPGIRLSRQEIPARTVVAAPKAGERIFARAKQLTPGSYLVHPRKKDRKNVSSVVKAYVPELDVRRGFNTWLVWALEELPLAVVADLSGISGDTKTLLSLVRYMRRPEPGDVHATLRAASARGPID